METLITHFFNDNLPQKGFKQVSFLTSDSENIKAGVFFFGYEGAVKLTEDSLSVEIEQGKIIKLLRPEITTDKEKYLWLDPLGNIWSSDDILIQENKKLIGPSGIKPASAAQLIYQGKIKQGVIGIKRRIGLSLSQDIEHLKLTTKKTSHSDKRKRKFEEQPKQKKLFSRTLNKKYV